MMSSTPILLSQYKLRNWLACQRRFQLQYVTRQTWPSAPVAPFMAEAFDKGGQFHRLMEQYYLGFDVELPPGLVDDLRLWWANFQAHPPDIGEGERRPEMSLTVPIGTHFLHGICDLLVLSDRSAHIVDWKTERKPRSAETLATAWQTRLYFMMLAEGGDALGRTYTPEQIKLTYWFARAPEKSVTLQYDTAQHTRNWAELTAEVGRIEQRLAVPNAVWPLTDDWSNCKSCRYQGFCGRVQDARPTSEPEEAVEGAAVPIFENTNYEG